MFFYVFIDPETIGEAANAESDLGRLIDVLRSLGQGCLMAETDLWRLEGELKEKIKSIPFQTERKMVGDLLINLWRKGPLVVMEGDDGVAPLVEFAITNAERDSIDLILTPSAINQDAGGQWEASGLSGIHTTTFSQTRHNIGAGLSFRLGDVSGEELFDQCFRKLINRAERIVIIDYALGEYYNNDQPANLRRWVLWIDQNLHSPGGTTLVIKTVGDPAKPAFRPMQRQIRDLQNEVDVTLELDTVVTKGQLPHRRFLVADRSCVDIDRGIDICDANGSCRQVDISYANQPR